MASVEDTLLTGPVRMLLEQSRRLLFAALDSLEGEKTIVWDRKLMSRMNLFAGPSLLAAHGVRHNCALDKPRPPETTHVVFFLSPTMEALDGLCKYIDDNRTDTKSLYQVFFIPEAWYVVREKLKERDDGKYWERLESVRELSLWWLPRDGAALSLAMPDLPSRLLINGDWTHLHRCATALNQFMALCQGKVPIYSRGKWAQDVARMLHKMQSAQDPSPPPSSLRINRLIIIDRWLDPLTPLLTQLTYAGLLDEVYGIGMVSSIKVPQAEFEEKENGESDNPFETKEKEIYLNDELFNRLRHVHINSIGLELGAILQEIKNDEQFDRDKMSIAEIQVLVKKMPGIVKRKNLCGTHMRLAEMVRSQLYEVLVDQIKVQKDLLESSDGDRVVPFIEDSIMDAVSLSIVLRLISIHSLTSGGLKPTVLSYYRRIVMQSYGCDAVNCMLKMQKMGLIREKSGNGKLSCDYSHMMYPQMKKQYELLVEDVRESDCSNPAAAYSGYCPLLYRILEEADKVRWVGWNKTGEHGGGDDDRSAVFIVGGATRAELSLIGRMPNVSLVMTSSIITGNRLIDNITRI